MASLTIPEQYKGGLSKLLSLSNASAQELQSAFENIPPTLYRKDLFPKIASKIKSVSEDDVNEIMDALFSLHLVRASADVSIESFVEDIIEAMEKSGEEDLRPSREGRDNFKQRLSGLLNINSLGIATKAYSVLYDHERNLTDTRILTDIRPIFGEEIEEAPVAAIIVHTLRIDYLQDGQSKVFFFAMDTADVQQLIDTLDRAKKKAESLKSLLASTKVPYLDAE